MLFCLCALGCAASETRHQVASAVERGAYGDALRVYEKSGRDRAVLRALAESILVQDAERAEPQRQHTAFTEFGLLGNRSRPWLERLAQPQRAKHVRVRALRLLMALGDADARAQLRPLAFDPDPEIADVAFAALDVSASADRAVVSSALYAPRTARRLAALALLSAASAPDSLREVAEVSRVDPQPGVRTAALFALERYGAAAIFAFERALNDGDESVRVVALEAFARAAPERAVAHLDQQLGAAITQETLAAAAALLRMRPAREPARARDALARGLSASESRLRSYAAVLVRTLPSAEKNLPVVRSQLAVESSVEVKLALALALGTSDPAARAALLTLSQGTSLSAAQAAHELARLGDAAAYARLIALCASPSSVTRATIARALGREQRAPQAVAALLADSDPNVRDAAAGAVLGGLLDA
jgi:HEAT repeat protein